MKQAASSLYKIMHGAFMTNASQSAEQIKQYHRMGQLVEKADAKLSQADESLLGHYRELNEDMQRRIKQFADPALGYTTKELDALLSQCKKFNYALGFSVLTRLLAVPKERREEAQTLAVKMKWGRRDLNNHIKATMGTRQQAGRRPKRFSDPGMLKAAIQATCLSWCRQADSMKKENAPAFDQLPAEFKHLYQQITRSIYGLAKFEETTPAIAPREPKHKIRVMSKKELDREKE